MQFKRAIRENIPLLIGLAGGTGSGKTFTGMRLATGISSSKPFAVIDTENGRAKHYADQFVFDVLDMKAPYRPNTYADAILNADKAGYPVIVVDSISHVWAGDGGCLDWHEEILTKKAGNNYTERQKNTMGAWLKPKAAHKAMVSKLLQVKAHVILCFRAEPKIEMVKDAQGKMQVVEKKSPTGLHGWMPISEKSLPYELTTSLLFMADKPGIPLSIKLQEQHKPFFPPGKLVTEESGKRLAEWASGGKAKQQEVHPSTDFVEYQHRIDACETVEQLNAQGEALKLLKTITDQERGYLRDQYRHRRQELELADKCASV